MPLPCIVRTLLPKNAEPLEECHEPRALATKKIQRGIWHYAIENPYATYANVAGMSSFEARQSRI